MLAQENTGISSLDWYFPTTRNKWFLTMCIFQEILGRARSSQGRPRLKSRRCSHNWDTRPEVRGRDRNVPNLYNTPAFPYAYFRALSLFRVLLCTPSSTSKKDQPGNPYRRAFTLTWSRTNFFSKSKHTQAKIVEPPISSLEQVRRKGNEKFRVNPIQRVEITLLKDHFPLLHHASWMMQLVRVGRVRPDTLITPKGHTMPSIGTLEGRAFNYFFLAVVNRIWIHCFVPKNTDLLGVIIDSCIHWEQWWINRNKQMQRTSTCPIHWYQVHWPLS